MDTPNPRRGLAAWCGLLVLLMLLTACGDGAPAQLPASEVAQLASETVRTLDEAIAVSDEQLQVAAEVVSESVQRGDLGTATPGTVVVGTNADFLPFLGRDANGDLMGFDLDLFNAVATRLGLVPTYVDMPFTNLTAALTAGEIDVAIAAITITDARDEIIDFTRPYFAASQSLGAPPSSPVLGVDDLGEGVVLAVLADTTGEVYARTNFAAASITPFPDRATAVGAVTAGAADAVFMDTDAVGEQVREGTLVLIEEVLTAERYGIALPEGNAPLRAAMNGAIDTMFEDGTYAAIFSQWFPARDVGQAVGLLR